MTCPHSGSDGSKERVDRRDFLISAVAIGGSNALAACIEREQSEPNKGESDQSEEEQEVNEERESEEDEKDWTEVGENLEYRHLSREEAQHAWNNYVSWDGDVPVMPNHHVLALVDYTGDETPTQDEREEMENALQTIEEAYEWSDEGLLFTVGYSPSYFDRFESSLPEHTDLPEPRSLSPFDSPKLDEYDISFHFASNHPSAVLEAEETLFGEREEVNGVDFEYSLSFLDKRERRTGFIGEGLPAENQDVDGIPDSEPVPENSPLWMGFHTKHGLEERHPFHDKTEDPVVHNQRSEAGVAIREGPFAGGTTQQVSKIRLDLQDWYGEMSVDERIQRMFTPKESIDRIGETGKGAKETRPFAKFPEEPENDAERFGMVGHAEKVGRARQENNVPLLLRRDFDTTDEGSAGVHFISLQRRISDFVKTRGMMNGEEFAEEHKEIEDKERNGILEFVQVERRANFLIPPPNLRSLPPANPEDY